MEPPGVILLRQLAWHGDMFQLAQIVAERTWQPLGKTQKLLFYLSIQKIIRDGFIIVLRSENVKISQVFKNIVWPNAFSLLLHN